MRIGITQRVEFFRAYQEKRDCLDQRWITLIAKAGLDIIIIPNALPNIDKWLEDKNIEGLILTGGNDLSELENAQNFDLDRDKTERKILQWASKNRIPTLGVCRGMQMMNFFLKGKLSKIENHAGINHAIKILKDDIIPNSYTEVNSFHNWTIKNNDLSSRLKAIAIAEDNTIEAVAHIDLPWIGIMWHPEREFIDINENNVRLIQNFFKNRY